MTRPAPPVHPIPPAMSSSEDTMDAATASEAEDAPSPATTSEAQDAPPPATASEAQDAAHKLPVAAAGAVQPAHGGRQGLRQEGDDPRARWFNDMRGWIMVLAVQIASSTYQAGLNPPGGFSGDGTPMLLTTSRNRYYYYMFVYFNTTAFVTSLAIIILLMNPYFYHSEAKVMALETIVVLDVVGLMGDYWAGTSSARSIDQTTKYTLGLDPTSIYFDDVFYS